ncbi:MAG TPA: sensor histidine kinase [Blastocatellia bacterium]|nr:sensor histidine kinase [Blastocatellia bacterium]
MSRAVSLITGLGRNANFGFIAVTIAAYVSAVSSLSYQSRFFSPLKLASLIAASILYLIIGTVGYSLAKRKDSLWLSIIYFAVQISLAASVLYLSRAFLVWLIMLPLAAQSVALFPARGVLIVCALLLSTLVVPTAVSSGWTPAVVVGLIYSAAIIFVVVFTYIAVSERKGRAEVERLAAELSDVNAKLREYAAQVEELATAKERNRLAREIHDSLGHYLTVINVQIEAARAVMDADRERSLACLGKAQSLTQEGLAEVRRSVAALHALPTENRPLAEALAGLADECRASGIATDLTITGLPRQLGPQAELTLYRAAQEGLTNVRKHAQAARAVVTLDYGADSSVRLVIEDDGLGASDANSGFGLLGVRERAQILGGAVRTTTSRGRGFKLEVELPA